MKRLVIGILAHVDSGKTTLSEAMLYHAGSTQKLGRVDHGDAFLDTHTIERDRGITIFSKQAMLRLDETEITLVDTPGHVDFSAETERTLRVLDYAILVISGVDGVQSHTETLWKLLKIYGVPTFVFVNKMDLAAGDRATLLANLNEKLSAGCVDFTEMDASFYENAAMASTELLDEYLETGELSLESLQKAIQAGNLFPCFFGSALKTTGVDAFLKGIAMYTREKIYGDTFGAKVFKISEDDKGQRLAFMKITGGCLQVKSILNGKGWSQKINELRVYSGAKYQNEQVVYPGSICAVPGLTKTYPGEGLGDEPQSEGLISEPVFTYSVVLPPQTDVLTALAVFRKLEEEDPQMHVVWNEHLQKINVQVMGEVQLEVLKRILEERFSIQAEFAHGSINYKETIQNTVEGVGHYEPLRHYAEVHLLMEPGERGSGLVFASKCREDVLDKNWQRLILTHLAEKTHIGVLSGSPLTDIKITLVNGRAHQKHTEGGDFRQATYRAVRQGLMQAESVLLEPYYQFTLEVPLASTGRAMSDLERMEAEYEAPITKKEMTVISGIAPISKIRDYHKEVIAYTHGLGRFSHFFHGYAPCRTPEAVIREIGYDCEADVENTPNSVFCAHGSGFVVKWDEVFQYMNLPAMRLASEMETAPTVMPQRKTTLSSADEDELLRIYENTYGAIQRKTARPMSTPKTVPQTYKGKPMATGPEYLLIDGYNIIFAWEDLKKIAAESLEDAREKLLHRMVNYQAIKKNNIIVVFDAYRVSGTHREIETLHGVSVVYTKEAETADSYIEKTTKQLCKNYRVKVATSDNLQQVIIFGHGAVRLSAMEFLAEVTEAEKNMREIMEEKSR